jgi:hypothetical protein
MACALAVSSATAETYVSGPISGVWTVLGSPYVATDTLLVLDGASPVIEEGVEVHFRLDAALLV